MNIKEIPMDALRDLIHRQMDAKRQAEAEIAEMDTLLKENIGEFYRRVCLDPAAKGAPDGR